MTASSKITTFADARLAAAELVLSSWTAAVQPGAADGTAGRFLSPGSVQDFLTTANQVAEWLCPGASVTVEACPGESESGSEPIPVVGRLVVGMGGADLALGQGEHPDDCDKCLVPAGRGFHDTNYVAGVDDRNVAGGGRGGNAPASDAP